MRPARLTAALAAAGVVPCGDVPCMFDIDRWADHAGRPCRCIRNHGWQATRALAEQLAAVIRELAKDPPALVTARRVAGEALDEWAASYEDGRTSSIPREHPRIASLRAELEAP